MMRNRPKNARFRRSRDSKSRTKGRKHAKSLGNSRVSKAARSAEQAADRVSEPAESPSTELAPIGRDARGRFAPGNNGHLSHGAMSEQRALALAPVRQEMVNGILLDLGFAALAEAPRALTLIVFQLVEARFIAQSYFDFLAASGGPITTKGRQHRAVDGYLKAADRVGKFGAMIGLERRARGIGDETAVEHAARMRAEREHQQADHQQEDDPQPFGQQDDQPAADPPTDHGF